MSRSLRIYVLFAMSILSLQAQTNSTHIAEFPHFRLISGKVDSDGLPISGARLCLLKPADSCYLMPSQAASSSNSSVYEFGRDPRSERLPLKDGGSLVFFSAQFDGGGSGTLDRLAILQLENGGKIVNLLPFVGVTNQSERLMWNVPEASSFPILVTADFYWDTDKETHFSRHSYTVSAYCFDTKSSRYVEAFSYRTSKKYPGLDEADQVHVLGPERAEISRRLRSR
jgi:hypothetical protein